MPTWWFPTPRWISRIATALDCLVLLDRLAVKPSWPLLKPGALVIADTRLCPELPAGEFRVHRLPLSRTALELGSERVTNIVALGALVALSGICDRSSARTGRCAPTRRAAFSISTWTRSRRATRCARKPMPATKLPGRSAAKVLAPTMRQVTRLN